MKSDQLASDNLGSHGFRFINKNGELCLCKSYSKSLNMIPADLLKDLKEGDSVDILLPVYCESIESIYDDSKKMVCIRQFLMHTSQRRRKSTDIGGSVTLKMY